MARVPVERGQAPGHGKKAGKRSGEKRTLMSPTSAYAGGTRPAGAVPVKLTDAEHEAILREVVQLLVEGIAPKEARGQFTSLQRIKVENGGNALPVPNQSAFDAILREAEDKILGVARESRDRAAGRQLLRLEAIRKRAMKEGKLNAAIRAEAEAARIKGTYAPIRMTVSPDEREQQAMHRAIAGMTREQLIALARGERPALGGKVIEAEGEPVERDGD